MNDTSPTLPSREPLGPAIIRFGCYTLILMLLLLLVPRVVEHGDVSLFREHGPVEWLQVVLLVLAGGMFYVASLRYARFRQSMILLVMVCIYAVIRELDATLDSLIPVVGWKVGALIPLYAIFYIHRHRHALFPQLEEIVTARFFGMLWMSFVVAVPIGQLVGNGHFLSMVMGDDYNRLYKRVIEETCELMGYLLIVISSVEMHVQLTRRLPVEAAQVERVAAVKVS